MTGVFPAPDDGPDADAQLMSAAAEGSEEAFAALIRRHQDALVNFFARMGALQDAEDLAQETFIRVFKYRERYRPTGRFTGFLYTLARHVWADRGRKALRQERLRAGLEVEAQTTGLPAAREQGAGLDVQAALDRLSPKLREVIVLNVYQGLRYHEVAAVLGVPLGTVKSRINLALHKLREALDEPRT
jgi:RNA polymerase sigma-70 factor (ECF subfamily)